MNTEKFESWALVELFGHQRIVGRVSEATLAGGAFIKVDVPELDGKPAFTRFYGPGAIYAISPISEEIARGLLAMHGRNEPVHAYQLPQHTSASESNGPDEGDDDPESIEG